MERKRKFEKQYEKNPELKAKLNFRKHSGRPRIEEDQSMLLKSIVDIALYGSVAHEKRQLELYRSIKTLDELTTQLQQDGLTDPKMATTLNTRRNVLHCNNQKTKRIRFYFGP